jgi:endonuclease-3
VKRTTGKPKGKAGPARRRASSRSRAAAAAAPIPALLSALRAAYPDAECALDHRDAFQLLASTILSAQCTDVRVNMVTPELFRRWPGPAALAGARQAEVEEVVRSTGFFRNKAKSLRGMASALRDRHGGAVPRTMGELTALPGVARKTANVVLGTAFGIAEGVVVDTHVGRIARRLGLSSEEDPVKVERDLMAALPREEWVMFSHRLIHHGRRVCRARGPRCGECPVAGLCPSRGIGEAGSDG